MLRPKKFNFDEWQEYVEDTLDEQFPKGKCKQRGNALVLYAEFQIFISEIMKDCSKDLNEIKNAVCTKSDGEKE